ncbi:MAG TPA: hypothetical protein VF937_02920 [Chloroflexota bacterium]
MSTASPATRRPAPPSNPFDVTGPYATAMRLSLALAVLPGLGTGLLLVLVAGAGLPISIAWPQLAQSHGQVQSFGFALVFIVAVGLQLFPRFLGAPLVHSWRAAWGAVLIAAALMARLIGQPLASGGVRAGLLLFATLGVPAGALVAGSAFHGLSRRSVQPSSGPAAAWRRFVAIGGLALGGSLIVSVWAGVGLANGDLLVPQGTDEALIHLELSGFATCLVLGVASRVFGRFLLLRTSPSLEAWVPRLALTWGLGLALVAGGWLIGESLGPVCRWVGAALELIVLCVWLGLIGLYGPPARESGTPYVTNPTRRWVRFAFAFLALSLALDTGLFGRQVLFGIAPSVTELSAARHALAQGFLLPMMVSMAARLLPIYSADVLKHRRLIELTVGLLLVGALVRVGAEALGGYQSLSGPLVALGGTLGICGFVVFAVGMWSALGRLPRSPIA